MEARDGPNPDPLQKSMSFNFRTPFAPTADGDIGLTAGRDRRFAFSRQSSFQQQNPQTPISNFGDQSLLRPLLTRTASSIAMPPLPCEESGKDWRYLDDNDEKKHLPTSSSSYSYGRKRIWGIVGLVGVIVRALRTGSRPMKRLALLISLNVAYSTAELLIGLFTSRVGLVSDAFHLTFGCGLLTFSLFAMAASRKKPDRVYTYGYKRLEVLAAFTNTLFLLFMAFSLAVEALHAFMQDESEHKHYLIVSAVTNLLVNLIGVWFFRSYARINIVYRKAEDMNYHSVFLHVLADSIRSAGLILASWFLALGVNNAEVLCLGLVSTLVFMVAMPLFKATGGILLQMAPPSIPASAFTKCWRQISTLEDVSEISQSRFWELVPGHVVGSLSIQLKEGADGLPILRRVHGLYHDLGVQELTIQTEFV